MNKRLVGAFLWSFAGLYAGTFLSSLTGASSLLGPALGLTFALAIAAGPMTVSIRRAGRARVDAVRPELTGAIDLTA